MNETQSLPPKSSQSGLGDRHKEDRCKQCTVKSECYDALQTKNYGNIEGIERQGNDSKDNKCLSQSLGNGELLSETLF